MKVALCGLGEIGQIHLRAIRESDHDLVAVCELDRELAASSVGDQVPVFEDRGWRRRAIVAAGRQDLRIDAMSPRDEKISILGASSDHMILDVTDSSRQWQVGDVVEFNLAYGALLAATTSAYVTKEFL